MAKVTLFILLATVICCYIAEASVVKDDDDDIDESPEGDGGWGKYNTGDCGKGCHTVTNCKNEQSGVVVADLKCSTIAQNLEVKNINAFIEVIAAAINAGCANNGNCGKCAGLLGLDGVSVIAGLLGGKNQNEGATCCSNNGWGGGNNKFTDCSKKNNACSNDCTSQSSGSGGSRGSGCETNCCTFNCNPSKRLI